MRDSAITNIIAKTYITIVGIFTFIFILFIGLFIVLQNGLYLDNLSISNLHAKNIYIKWQNNINLSIQELNINTNTHQDETKADLKQLSKYFKILSETTTLFHSIVIDNIHIKDVSGSFHFTTDAQGFLVLHSPSLDLQSDILLNAQFLQLYIKHYDDRKRDISAQGNIFFDIKKAHAYSDLHINIHNDVDLSIYSLANQKQIRYSVLSNKDIQDISHLIKIAHLPKEVIYWAYTAIDMQALQINDFHGFIDYNSPQNAYKNMYISAIAQKLNYTYNPKLDAVHTLHTDLEFTNGILYIKPQNAYSYNMYLDRSWLQIDFSKQDELLTLHLLFDGMLNKDMLHVLKSYKVDVPFLQRQGKITTNLILRVNLQNVNDIDIVGDFYTKIANFDYLGLNIDIFDTHLNLNNYDVVIDKMKATYKDIAKANVFANFDAKTSKGIIDFDFSKIELKGLSLYNDKRPLHVTYSIDPKQDTIDILSSKWKYKSKDISVEPFLVQFDLKTLKANIPITYFDVKDLTNGYINGKIDLRSISADFDIDLLKLNFNGIELSQTTTPLKINFNKDLSIYSNKDILLNVNGSEYKVKNFYADYKDGTLYFKHTILEIGKYITTKVYVNYNLQSKRIHASLNDLILKNPKSGKILYKNNKVLIGGNIYDNNINIFSNELNAGFSLDSNKWELTLNSLATIAKKSSFLHKYKLNDGQINFYKNRKKSYTQFSGHITYPYAFFIKNDKKINTYDISGEVTKEYKTYLTVNKNTHLKISNNVMIKTHNTGLNVNTISTFVKDIFQSNTKKSNFKLSMDAVDSFLYLGNKRKMIADAIHLQYFDNILTAQLIHKSGNAGFKLEGDKFHLYGKNFNDKFMQNLLVLSKFRGGSLDFVMDGTLDDYNGILYMNDTTMMDYKLLNNILAFINTVPSLITFSLPGYNKDGLHVENAYMKFHAKKGVFDISDIYLESKELTVLGKGKADTNNNNIDLTLNLKTDLGSNLSKIPLVGYIILDGKNISTTLKVTGKLNDPVVKTMIAKDMIVAPLNIIKRTLTLPFNFIKKLH